MSLPSPLRPLRPEPAPSIRPWAGTRLGPADGHIGELWLAGPASIVATDDGPRTLDELAATLGGSLVGSRGLALLGRRFPLLTKLIDAADWLSLQVHPDDALARDLYGPAAVGKVEAWVVVEAGAGAELVTGPRVGLADGVLMAAIADGTASHEHCRHEPARPGDTLLLRSGTLHAIGADTFVYEIEQPSDLTFRVSDWGRPTGRDLHVAAAIRTVDPARRAELRGTGFQLDGGALEVREFRLELLRGPLQVTRRPAGASPEIVTALLGEAVLGGAGDTPGGPWSERIGAWDTLVVPAAVPSYGLELEPGALVALGSVP